MTYLSFGLEASPPGMRIGSALLSQTPESEAAAPRRKIVIVGGGATGVLMAAHMSRAGLAENFDIVMVEPGSSLARGLAYSTDDPNHLLNVRVANMSAFADDPRHLIDWLARHGADYDIDESTMYGFIPRSAYGDYLYDIFCGLVERRELSVVFDSCEALDERPNGVQVVLASGRRLTAAAVIVATGVEMKAAPSTRAFVRPYASAPAEGLGPEDEVLLIGSGLTMIDTALSLARRRPAARITVLSRRGLLPLGHRLTRPWPISRAEVPFGAAVSVFLRWLRREADLALASGGDWRDAIDGLRPHIRDIWRAWSGEQKKRFLRHARAYWDIHRHRMAPEIERQIRSLSDEGRLAMVRGRLRWGQDRGDAVEVEIAGRRGEVVRLTVARVIDCTGFVDDVRTSANPLIRSLIANGAARPDTLGLGLDLDDDHALIGADGAASQRIKVIGPPARGAFWESVAIPDIRLQCEAVARGLAALADPAGRRVAAKP